MMTGSNRQDDHDPALKAGDVHARQAFVRFAKSGFSEGCGEGSKRRSTPRHSDAL